MSAFVTVVPLIRVIRGKDQFTYCTDLSVRVGELVWTPWRNQTIVGVVTTLDVIPFPKAKQISHSLHTVLPPAYWTFIQWFSQYYFISLASTLHAMLPSFVHQPRMTDSPPRLTALAVSLPTQRQSIVQETVRQALAEPEAVTILYQRMNELAAVVLGIVKRTTGPFVLICPEEQDLAYWQRLLAGYQPITVVAQQSTSVRRAWQALLQHERVIILGTKRLALLPLTEADSVVVLHPEHTAHKQWAHNPRYHVQRVVEQQTQPIYLSYAPRLEQYVQQHTLTTLLTPTYLPKLTIIQPIAGEVLTETILEQVRSADIVVVWHQRTGVSKSVVCQQCHYWTPQLEIARCPNCQGVAFRAAGFGTTMLKRRLTELFPGRAIIEVTAQTKFAAVSSTDRPIYVGTSAVFDRIPWEQVQLAIATSLDAQLAQPDFRSHETTLQQLIWLRNHVPELMLQTYAGEHPVVQAVSQPFPEDWYRLALHERRRFHYPPAGEMIRVIHTVTHAERIVHHLTEVPASAEWMIDREN